MDTNLAWEMIRVSFSVGRELRDLLLRLKEQCSAEEYKGHARAIAGAIDGVNTALIDRALAAQPDLKDRIEAELAEFGRIWWGGFSCAPMRRHVAKTRTTLRGFRIASRVLCPQDRHHEYWGQRRKREERAELRNLTAEQLVDRFMALAIDYDEEESPPENDRLYWQLDNVKDELNAREGEVWRLLLPLYRHPDIRIRHRAAEATRDKLPELARDRLLAIDDVDWLPPEDYAGLFANVEGGRADRAGSRP